MSLRYRVPLLGPFYGLFWGGVVVRCGIARSAGRSLGVSPVQRPLLQRSAPGPVSRSYGFVPDRRECVTVEGGPLGSDRYM